MGLEAFLSTEYLARVEHFEIKQVILMSVTTDSEATDLCERARSLDETDTRYFWLKLLGIVRFRPRYGSCFSRGCLAATILSISCGRQK